MRSLLFATALALAGGPALGQPTVASTAIPEISAPVASVPAPASPCNCLVIPAMTPVSVTILATLGSKISKTGDMFPIRLAAPISVEGRELVPAGATGMGEVVFAKKSGGSGVGGELVLAARYLNVRGYSLRLRSMRVSAVGKDQIGMALAASEAISFLGFAIKGKNTEIPEGTIASAKTAETFALAAENSVSQSSSISELGEVK